jgi:hypothetical protein
VPDGRRDGRLREVRESLIDMRDYGEMREVNAGIKAKIESAVVGCERTKGWEFGEIDPVAQ